MKKLFSKALCLLLVVLVAASTVTPALAATYRPGAQSGPSSSYAGGVYYDNYKKVPITGDGRTDVIAIALSQLGYQEGASNGQFSGEVSGRNNYVEFSYNMGEFGLGYGGSDYPWCACFVSWCLYQSHCTDQNTWKDLGRYHVGDYKYIWKEISCSQWVRQLKGASYYKYSAYEGGSYTPKYGDLVFFQNSGGVAHIGICLYVANGRIYTVEGNTSDSSGLEANGGGVYFKNYSLSTSYINGYGVLPYKSDSSVAKIDYSGNNPTPGLYVANAAKYIYATETATTKSWTMSRFTMFEVTEVCSNGRLKVIAKDNTGVVRTGYVSNNSDRVIQLSSTATDAVDTARANLQKVINQAESLWFYDYSEAQIYAIRQVYNTACTLVGNTYALDGFRLHLYAGAEGASASIAQPAYVDVYVSNNGADYVFVGSPTLDAAASASYWAELSKPGYAARYVKFVVGPSGDSTWVFLNELEVYGTALTGGENVALTTGQSGTPAGGYEGNLTNGLTDDWYGIANGGSVIIDLGSRYQITKVQSFVSVGENGPSSVSVSISPDGTNYVKSGELVLNADATEGYWAELNQDAMVGRYVKLEAENANGLVLLSELEAYGTPYVQSADSNVAMGKEMIYTTYEGSPFTALLNDGLASNVFQYGVNNSSWFAFRNSGDSTTDNVTINNAATGEGRGIITIGLGGQAEITDVSVHLYAGANDAGAVQPRYINVYHSVDGASFGYMGYIPLDSTQTGAYWAKLDISSAPITAGFVKLALGTLPGDLVLLNEIKVGGLQVSLDAPNEPGTLSGVVLSGDFNKWNPTPNMMVVDDYKVTTNMTLAAGTYEFKIYYDGVWYGNGGAMTDGTAGTAWVLDSESNNCTITTTRDGQYAFTFDRETKELLVSYVPDALYLRGSFNDWGTVDVMSGYTASGSNFKAVSGGYSALAPNVVFEGAFSINFYFTPAKAMDGQLKLYYWKLDDYNAADVLTADNATGVVVMEETSVVGQYLGAVTEIAAKQIDQTVYVCGVYESNGVTYNTGVIAYSLAAYCLDRINKGTETMKAFAAQTVVYGYYAKQYFA